MTARSWLGEGISKPSFHVVQHKGILEILTNTLQIGHLAPKSVDDPIRRELELQSVEASIHEWVYKENEGLSLLVPATVYPPREDTGLLFSCLSKLGSGDGRKLLEIGCGSGAVSIALAKLGWEVTACDVNPLAIAATTGNASHNKVNLMAVEGGLDEGGDFINQQLIESQGPFDIITWNLPYLSPVKGDEEKLGPLEEAGLVDTQENNGWGVALLQSLTKINLLKQGGAIYLLHTNNERGNRLQSRWRADGWATRISSELQFDDGERLTCFAAWKPHEKATRQSHDVLDSTNQYLLEKDLPIGSMVTAKQQLSGRGQRKRVWNTSEGDFAGSWILNPELMEYGSGMMQLDAGVAVIDAICASQDIPLPSAHWTNCNAFSNHNLSIHWPNDVWAASGKLAGCLIEGRQTGKHQKIVLGIGVNLGISNTEDYPSTGLPDITNSVTLEAFTDLIDTAISSQFETGILIPPRPNQKNVVWSLMTNHLSRGLSLIQDGEKLTVKSISHGGELICHDGRKRRIISDSHNIIWN
jgi:biotin-(acetyl-CoA carboxylase) ligase/methylase of polypeptide subunit release factors